MRISTQLWLAFLLLFLAFFCAPIFGSSASAADSMTVRVGVYENNPKLFTDESGDVVGFWPDIIEYIAAEEGWEVEYVHGTWTQCLDRLANNEVDVMPDVAYTQERAELYDFSNEAVYVSWSRVYTREGVGVESILDLEGRTIAVLQGSINYEGPDGIKTLVGKFGISCTFIEVDNYTEVFELVRSGEADAGVASKDFGYKNKAEFGVVETAIIFQPSSLYFAFPKDASLTPYLIERIDSHVQGLKADKDSSYYQALATWFGIEPAEKSVIPAWLKWVLISVGGLALLLGGGYLILRSQVRTRTRALREEIGQREKAERALRKSERRYRTTLDNMLEGCQIIDRNWRYVYLNDTAAQHGRRPKEELLGHTMMEVYPGIEKTEMFVHLRRCMKQRVSHRMENEFVYPDGSKGWFELSFEPAPEGVFILSLDITERKLTEVTLRKSEASLAEAQRVAHIGNWELDLVTDELSWSDEVYRIFELKPRQFKATYEAFLENIHPDDREMVNKAYTDSVKNKVPYDIVHRLLLKDGTVKYVNERCETYYDDGGKPIRSLGTVQDVTELKRAERTLKKWSQELEQRVQQRTRELEQRGQQLAEANVNLEEMSRHKSQFLANMSHELRTPLNSIIGYTKLMLDGLEGEINEEQHHDLATVYKNSQHLLTLINDLLDLSRIEAGKVKVDYEAFTIAELLDEVIPSIERLAQDKGLTLDYKVDPAIDHIYADKAKTKQTLINILANAVKFTEKGGIKLNIAESDGELLFSVSDSGIGIEKEDLEVIFDSFKQVGPAQIAGFEGTGLGLAISKQFVEMQGGKIWAKSQPGKGSTFYFTLPKKKARRR